MKKNVTTTTVPTITASDITAAATAAALLDQIKDLADMSVEAVKNGMSEEDFVKYVSMAYFAQASDLDTLKNIQANARSCYKKATIMAKAEEAAKVEAAALEKYQSLQSSDRIMLQITNTMASFGGSKIAEEINKMVMKNASAVKVAAMIGAVADDAETMNQIKYIYTEIKKEKELMRFAATFVHVYEELCCDNK